MEKSKIYTQTGDSGSTSLVGGSRVSKTDPRLEAYGTVDELNAHLGLLQAWIEIAEDKALLHYIQHKLFDIGSLLATPSDSPFRAHLPTIAPSDVARLEQRIDAIDAVIPKLTRFVLPGGTPTAAQAHIARTVCRRAERAICATAQTHEVDAQLLKFINRLSDYLFILARFVVNSEGKDEIFWDKDCI